MSGEAWLYLFAVLINAVNLFLQVFFTIMYSDLEWYVCKKDRHACCGPPNLRVPRNVSMIYVIVSIVRSWKIIRLTVYFVQ